MSWRSRRSGQWWSTGLVLGCLLVAAVTPAHPAVAANGNLVTAAGDSSSVKWQVRVSDDCYDDKVSCVYRDTSASSRTDIWAVGDQVDDGSGAAGLLRHWNGDNWATVDTAIDATFTAVSTKSSGQTWVAGYTVDDGRLAPLSLRWTGVNLQQIPVPSGGGDTTVEAISVGRGRAWMVGTTANEDGTYRDRAWRWTGARWQEVAIPDLSPAAGGVVDIAARSDDDVWVVGNRGDRHYVQHWDGERWSTAKLPVRFGTTKATNIQSVYGQMYVIGSRTTAAQPYRERPLVQQLVEGSWRYLPGPDYHGSLESAARDGAGGVWFGGNDHSTGSSRLDRWDGTSMRAAAGPEGELASLTNVPGTTQLWASGGAGVDDEGYHAYVAEHTP